MLKYLNVDWQNVLADEISKDYFLNLLETVACKYNTSEVYPPKKEVFRAFNLVPLESIKVVILGQDPYPQEGNANGLAFSVNADVKPPASLRNILKRVVGTVDDVEVPQSVDLTRWAEQGVFLLNSILTVDKGSPISHSELDWEKFTDAVIELISNKVDSVVFMLWGQNAQKKINLIGGRHKVLIASHPVARASSKHYFGMCNHFNEANDFLDRKIKW